MLASEPIPKLFAGCARRSPIVEPKDAGSIPATSTRIGPDTNRRRPRATPVRLGSTPSSVGNPKERLGHSVWADLHAVNERSQGLHRTPSRRQ